MTMIARNLQHVRERIAQACAEAGRDPSSVRLLAVSKTFGAHAVAEAAAGGQFAFGENYITEGIEKINALRAWPGGADNNFQGPLQWHCIGPVQSNKTRLVAMHFDWMQSLDRLKIAQRLNEHRPPELPPLQVCLQVNVDGGANKSGLPPAEVEALAREVAQLPRLRLRGLMAIPEPAASFAAAREAYAQVKGIFERVNAAVPLETPMDTLSLGMTADLEAAIHAGSTMVRVGTAVFGERP